MSLTIAERLTLQTRYILTQFSRSDTKSIAALLHPNIVWLGSDSSQYIQGSEKVCALWENPARAPFMRVISHQRYDLIYYDASLGIVAGYFDGQCPKPTAEPAIVRQGVTFVWKLLDCGWRVFHIHLSASLTLPENTNDPSSGVRQAAPAQGPPKPQKQLKTPGFTFRGKNAKIYFLKPNDILYVEADNINCTIHTVSGLICVCQPISEVKQILSGGFVHIHRSFIVNREYVAEVQRYSVRLRNGTLLPIPEKRYRAVKELLTSGPPPVPDACHH